MIERKFNGMVIYQRPQDGYINLNQMFEAAGKRLDVYLKSEKTKELLARLEAENLAEHTTKRCNAPALISEKINAKFGGGTWANYIVALDSAAWISVDFRILVWEWVHEWITTGKNPLVHTLEHSEPDLAQLTTRELDIQDTEILYEQQTNHINYYAAKMQRARIARERTARRLRQLHNEQLTLLPTIHPTGETA